MNKIVAFLMLVLVLITCIIYYTSNNDAYYTIKSGSYYLVDTDSSGNLVLNKGTKDIFLTGYYNTLGVFTSAECDAKSGKDLNEKYELGYNNPILYQGVFYYSLEKVSLAKAITDPRYLKYLLDRAGSGGIVKDWWGGVPSQEYEVISIVVDIENSSIFPVQRSCGFTYYLSYGFSKFKGFFDGLNIDNIFKKSLKKINKAD